MRKRPLGVMAKTSSSEVMKASMVSMGKTWRRLRCLPTMRWREWSLR